MGRPDRVVLALEPGGSIREAAAAGARLAARLRAPLFGLAVEDEGLLGLGAHVRYVALPGGTAGALDPAALRAELRAWATQAERAVAAAARNHGLAWDFAVRRGPVGAVLAAAQGAGDLLLVPREGRALFAAARLGGGGVAAAWAVPGPALLAGPAPREGAVAVALAGGPVDDALAAALAVSAPDAALEVLLCGDGGTARAAAAWLAERGRAARYTPVARLTDALRAGDRGWETVVLARRALDDAERRAAGRLACGVLLVG